MTWLYDKEEDKMVTADEYYTKKQKGVKRSDLPAPQVMRDIEPFRNVAVDGAMIGSRSAKREMMKQHGLVEVGNERGAPAQRRPRKVRTPVKESIKRSLRELGA